MASDWRNRSGESSTGSAALSSGPVAKNEAEDWRNRTRDRDSEAKDEEATGKRRCLNLAMSALMLRGGTDKPATASTFARNGTSEARVENMLKYGACRCKRRCIEQFTAGAVLSLCTSFWSLTPVDQELMIHTMYTIMAEEGETQESEALTAGGKATEAKVECGEEWDGALGLLDVAEEATRMHTKWHLLSKPVCMEAFYRILGVGKKRLLKMMHGAVDQRRNYPGAAKTSSVEAKQTNLCHRFFAEYYRSCAEPLPHEYLQQETSEEATEKEVSADHPSAKQVQLDYTSFEKTLVDLLPQFLRDTTDVGLPLRYMQHGRVHDLYWVFVATVTVWLVPDAKVPSWSIFWRAWSKYWRNFLAFRKASQHSKCNFCWKCKGFLAKHLSLTEKHAIVKRLRTHLQMQYTDRCLYWSLRWASRCGNLGVLTIIIDSMDKSKFALPHYSFAMKPKMLDELIRPVVTLTAGIAHGYCTAFYIADETLSHGADAFLDALVLTLDHVLRVCQARGLPMPLHLVVQSDNPTNQAKNSLTCMFLAFMVATNRFLTCTLNFLTVGHTHEDIDQLFAIVVELIRHTPRFESPAQIVQLLSEGMAKHMEQKGEELKAEPLHLVRDFAVWLAPLKIQLYSAFVSRRAGNADVLAPHSFYFKRRRDLFCAERAKLQEARMRDRSLHDEDVFILVKQHMHSKELQQPPLLILPYSHLDAVASTIPLGYKPRHAVDEARARKLRKFVGVFREAGLLNFPAAATYYEDLLNGGGLHPPPQSQFLMGHRLHAATSCYPTQNVEFPHLPTTSWEMKVRYQM